MKKFVKKTRINFPILLDKKGNVAREYGVRGTPAHFLIDNNGVIRAYASGFKNMNSKSARKLIEFIMENEY